MFIDLLHFRRLHVYETECGEETYVAYSPEDAIKAWEEFIGDKWENLGDPDYKFYLVDDRKMITINCEEDDFHEFVKHSRPLFSKIGRGKNYPHIVAPAWAWALKNGRGFLCSTEW